MRMASFRLQKDVPRVCGRCELGETNMNWDEIGYFDQRSLSSSSFVRGG